MYLCTTNKQQMKLRIKEIQQKKDVKNVDIANNLGMSPQMIAYYHTGDRTPTFATLEKIAEYLQCNALELLTPPEGFTHFYDEQGCWLGIVRKYPYQDKEADVLQQNEQHESKEQ